MVDLGASVRGHRRVSGGEERPRILVPSPRALRGLGRATRSPAAAATATSWGGEVTSKSDVARVVEARVALDVGIVKLVVSVAA